MTKQRLKILSKSEINELYDIPHFNSNEREKYFSLDKKEYAAMSKCGSLASKLHFTLQLGYFKAALIRGCNSRHVSWLALYLNSC
jgi:hypothetical protein